jgi:hypothetical protein
MKSRSPVVCHENCEKAEHDGGSLKEGQGTRSGDFRLESPTNQMPEISTQFVQNFVAEASSGERVSTVDRGIFRPCSDISRSIGYNRLFPI